MKIKIFLLLLISAFSLLELSAQTVQVCISINGTPMPPSRTWSMCRKNTVTSAGLSNVTLTATNCAAIPESNVTIKWKNLSIAPYTDSLDNIITAADTGRWEATIVNNVTLITYKDTLHLIYYPPISIAITNAGSYNGSPLVHGCPTSNFTLTTSQTGTIAGYQWYKYNPKVLIPGATAATHRIFERNKFYIIDARDANNCKVSDTSNSSFFGPAAVAVDLGPDPPLFCEGNTFNLVSLVATGFTSPANPTDLKWGIGNTPMDTLGGQPSNPAPPVVITPPGGVSKVWLLVEQFPNCSNVDTITITTTPTPIVNIGPASVFACYGANTNLTATISLGAAPFNYTWTSTPSSSLPSASTITVSPTSNTTYTVSVTDANNCGTGTDNVLINVNPQIFTSASNDTTICKDPLGTANLLATASGGVGAITYNWSPAAGLSSTNTLATSASISTTTTYTFTATDANTCTNTESVTVTSYEPSVAPITNPSIISETKTATLEAAFAGNAGSSFLWKTDTSPAVITTGSSIYLEYQGPDTVRYVVIVTNPGNGCVNKDTIQVWSISDNTLMYVPNIFSPNALNPENKTLKIYGDNLLPDGFKWIVYNKWGNLTYETTDLAEAQYTGITGDRMNEGVYTYIIVGKFKNGKDVQESPYYKGTFSVIK